MYFSNLLRGVTMFFHFIRIIISRAVAFSNSLSFGLLNLSNVVLKHKNENTVKLRMEFLWRIIA